MSIPTLTKIDLSEDDFHLLTRMAEAAGKSRDAFVSDVMKQMVDMERALLRGEGPREQAYTAGEL